MEKKRMAVLVAAIAVLVAVAGFYVFPAPTKSAKPAVQPANISLELGEQLYAQSCATCHGSNLEGQENWKSPGEDGLLPPPPHNEDGHTWHHGDGLLFEYTKLGGAASLELRGVTNVKSGMPSFGDTLTDQEIWNILAYIKSTWSPRTQKLQKARSDAEQAAVD